MKNFYIKRNNLYFSKTCRFCSNKKKAMRFPSKTEAERILRSNVPSIARAECAIIPEYSNLKHNKKGGNKIFVGVHNNHNDKTKNMAFVIFSAIKNRIKLAGTMEEIDTFLFDCRGNLEKRHEYLSNKLSLLDKEIVDIIHYIEFNELFEKEGFAAYKLLHNKTKERRVVKNEKYDIEFILNVIDGKKDFEDCKTHFNRNTAPPYIPRALPELFQKAM